MTMKMRMLRACVLLGFCLPSFSQDAPMFRGSPQHSGVYEGDGPTTFTKVKWKFHTAGMVIGSPVVVHAVVYVGSTDGNLYAIDSESGKLQWKFAVKSRIPSTPAVAGGVVYFPAYDGNFYAVDASDGKLKWKFKTGGERRFAAKHLHGVQPVAETMPDPFDSYLSSPAVLSGTVYFGSGDGNVYALNAESGALNWKFQTGDIVHASPAIADGTVFIGSWDSFFYAIDAKTGQEKWRFKTGEDPDIHNQVGIQSSAAVADGMVFFGCRDSHLYALDARTGEKKWAYSANGSWVVGSPAVKNGKVYFPTSDSSTLFWRTRSRARSCTPWAFTGGISILLQRLPGTCFTWDQPRETWLRSISRILRESGASKQTDRKSAVGTLPMPTEPRRVRLSIRETSTTTWSRVWEE